MATYKLRDFTFVPTDTGGLEITVRTKDSHDATIIRALHLTEDELYELLAAIGLSAEGADEWDEDDDVDDEGDDLA
jgi:hypothetical protein